MLASARMSLPRISIVTPSYNRAALLEQTISSVLSQEVPALEYLVLDGGSTDGNAGIIGDHRNFKPRSRVR